MCERAQDEVNEAKHSWRRKANIDEASSATTQVPRERP